VSTDPRLRIAERAARELAPGEVVNLGIGIPNLIPRFLPGDANVFVHTENGLLGVGPPPSDEELDEDLIDAAKRPVTALPGAAYFDSAQSFAMIRGGHIDVAVLGALQVSEDGDIANWAVPGKDVLGVGGAMDLVVGARRVIVTMTSRSSSSEPKVVDRCTYPLTAPGVVDAIVTELAVFRRVDGRLRLAELLDGASVDDVAAVTTARFEVDPAPVVGSA
jgi:3-oxoacid CoA-transferase B subunit